MKIQELLTSAKSPMQQMKPDVRALERVPTPDSARRVVCLSPTTVNALQNNYDNDIRTVEGKGRGFFCLSPRNMQASPKPIPTYSEKVSPAVVGSAEKENSPVEKSSSESLTSDAPQSKKERRAYVHNTKPPPQQHLKVGRWTKDEHDRFLKGMNEFPKQWKRIADLIGTRTVLQVRTHAQKFFQSTKMAGNKNISSQPEKQPKPVKRPKAKTLKRKVPSSSSFSSSSFPSSSISQPRLVYHGQITYLPQNTGAMMMPIASIASSMYAAPTSSNNKEPVFKRVKIIERHASTQKVTQNAASRLSACRAQDGVHSRSSVDAVSALLALGSTA